MQRRLIIGLVTLSAALLASSCRTSRRGVPVGGNAATAKVYMNFPPHEFDTSLFSYELSGCEGIPALVGKPAKDLSYVSFEAVGLKRGLSCQLRVKDLAANPEVVTFTAQDKVLFGSDNVVLNQDVDGNLKSDLVSLEPRYQLNPRPGVDQFKLKIPVSFDKAPTSKDLKAVLECSPALLNPSISKEIKDASGSFTFAFAFVEGKEHTCKSMTIRGKHTYDGTFTKPFIFTPEKDVMITADETLKVKKVDSGNQIPDPGSSDPNDPQPPSSDGNPDDIKVNTTKEDCTGENEYFDIDKNECIKPK